MVFDSTTKKVNKCRIAVVCHHVHRLRLSLKHSLINDPKNDLSCECFASEMLAKLLVDVRHITTLLQPGATCIQECFWSKRASICG